MKFIRESDSKGSIPTTCSVAPSETLNNWIPLTPLSQMAEQEYDVLIIGTGAGGGFVLWRLCEQWKREKKRIGIIERGDQVIPTHARNLSTLNQERLLAYFSYLSKPLPGSLPESREPGNFLRWEAERYSGMRLLHGCVNGIWRNGLYLSMKWKAITVLPNKL